MSDDKAEPLTIDVEIVEEDESLAIKNRMAGMQKYQTKPKPKSKKAIRVNVTKTCNDMGFNPAEALVHFGRNDYQALGQPQPIAAHTQLTAIIQLVKQTTPTYNPIDFVDTEEEEIRILPFVPERGIVEKTLEEFNNESDPDTE